MSGNRHKSEEIVAKLLQVDGLTAQGKLDANALRLPTFQANGITLLKRLTLVIDEGAVEQVFYPDFPPDQSASDMMAWLSDGTRS